MGTMKIDERERLQRKYFKQDSAFYAQDLSISCFEQAQYQSLRNWEMDYFLVFCEDINVKICVDKSIIRLNTHNLEYNNFLCKYKCVTKEYQEAEKSIEQILNKGHLVVFKTAMDYLHTYAWYHEKEPFTRTHHYSIIIGSDEMDYFYIDVPGTRNSLYFREHPKNQEVGKINRNELLYSFQYCCEIGFFEVSADRIKDIADVNKILKGIVVSYYSVSEDNINYVGKQALEKMVKMLRNEFKTGKLLLDEFTFALFASRCRILRINIQRYESCIKQDRLERCKVLLQQIATKWDLIKCLVIKNTIVAEGNTGEKIAKIIEEYVIPWSDELMYHFKISVLEL